MTTAKIWFIGASIFVFVGSFMVGLAGVFGRVVMPESVMVSAFITPCLGIVLAVIKAEHIFNDPEAVTKLKGEYAEEKRALKHAHADEIQRLKSDHFIEMAASTEAFRQEEAHVEQLHADDKAKLLEQHQEDRKADQDKIAAQKKEIASWRAEATKHMPPPRAPTLGSIGHTRRFAEGMDKDPEK